MGRMAFEAFPRALDANGKPVSGAKLYIYQAGTTTPVTAYTDAAMSTAATSPAVADSAGYFPVLYLQAGYYKYKVTTSTGATLSETDNVPQVDIGTTFTASSVSGMKALKKATLSDGATCHVWSYTAGTGVGGGLFVWSASSTTTDDGGLVIAATEGGTGRWLRKHDGTVTPMMWGGVSSATTNATSVFTALVAAVNADTTICGIDLKGTWLVNGGLISFSRDKLHIVPSGMSKLIRRNGGKLIEFTGNYNTFHYHFIEDDITGPFTGAFVSDVGARNSIAHNHITGGGGQQFSLSDGSQEPRFMFNVAIDSAVSNLVMGPAINPLILGNIFDTAAVENVTGDNGTGARVIGNYASNGGGVANFAWNDATAMSYIGNVSQGGNYGFGTGQKGGTGTTYVTLMGNIAKGASGYGYRGRSRYGAGTVTNITKANPGVVTFARTAISAITQANPCVITTSSAHGFVTGDLKKINNVGGMTQLNGKIYRIRVIDATNVCLQLEEEDTLVSSLSYSAYTSGGNFDVPFEVGRGPIVFSSVGGMVEINGLQTIWPIAITDNVVTMGDSDGANFDTSGFTAYTSGGTVSIGGSVRKSTLMGNVAYNNTKGDFSWMVSHPTFGDSQNTIVGNYGDPAKSFFGLQKSSLIQNGSVYAQATLAATVTNATGDGTIYNPTFNEVDDPWNAYNAGTGRFTAPSAGFYEFELDVEVSGASSATGAYTIIKAFDPAGVAISDRRDNMAPDGAVASASTWRGRSVLSIWLEKDAYVFPRVAVTGLTKTVSVVAGSTFICRLS